MSTNPPPAPAAKPDHREPTATPRTDSAEGYPEQFEVDVVEADFARQLERELVAANEKLAEADRELERLRIPPQAIRDCTLDELVEQLGADHLAACQIASLRGMAARNTKVNERDFNVFGSMALSRDLHALQAAARKVCEVMIEVQGWLTADLKLAQETKGEAVIDRLCFTYRKEYIDETLQACPAAILPPAGVAERAGGEGKTL